MVGGARKCVQFRMLLHARNNRYTDSKLQIEVYEVYLQQNKFLTPQWLLLCVLTIRNCEAQYGLSSNGETIRFSFRISKLSDINH